MEDLEKLDKLTTKRLLAYYKAERKRYKSNPLNISGMELASWTSHLASVKTLLDEREHVEK